MALRSVDQRYVYAVIDQLMENVETWLHQGNFRAKKPYRGRLPEKRLESVHRTVRRIGFGDSYGQFRPHLNRKLASLVGEPLPDITQLSLSFDSFDQILHPGCDSLSQSCRHVLVSVFADPDPVFEFVQCPAHRRGRNAGQLAELRATPGALGQRDECRDAVLGTGEIRYVADW